MPNWYRGFTASFGGQPPNVMNPDTGEREDWLVVKVELSPRVGEITGYCRSRQGNSCYLPL